jgi:GNAT superfamily N-acetyltransferase
MTFAYLSDFPEYIPTVAKWLYDEFAHEFRDINLEDWTKLFSTSQQGGSTTIIALENDQILGTASLDLDDLPLRPELSPWLASVYVPVAYRSRGIGSLLIEHVEQEARRQGFSKIVLYTLDHEGFYARRGWGVLERLNYWDRDLVVMEKVL